MYKIKGVFDKLNKENTSYEKEINHDLICNVCNSVISNGQVYISDEKLNVYCSEECYLIQLNSKYY